MSEFALANARIVLADEVVEGSILVRDGVIVSIDTGAASGGEDVEGDYVIPGLVELHTDHFENHYRPRPGVTWNAIAALQSHDAQVAGAGITTVFETETGKPFRKETRIPNTTNYFASPVVGDGKIYVAGENGVVVVLKNSPDYEVLAENDLGDDILGTPAISDGRLFFRTRMKLICVGE